MDITTLLILTLAAWRLASLLTNEDGPFYLLARLRALAGVRHNEYGVVYADNVKVPGVAGIGGVLACLWCCSVWVGVGLAVAWYFAPGYTFWLCLPFALSGGAIIVDEITGVTDG